MSGPPAELYKNAFAPSTARPDSLGWRGAAEADSQTLLSNCLMTPCPTAPHQHPTPTPPPPPSPTKPTYHFCRLFSRTGSGVCLTWVYIQPHHLFVAHCPRFLTLAGWSGEQVRR